MTKRSLVTWIKENREELDCCIHNVIPNYKINDRERKLWVLNDEGLYNWAKSENVTMDG